MRIGSDRAGCFGWWRSRAWLWVGVIFACAWRTAAADPGSPLPISALIDASGLTAPEVGFVLISLDGVSLDGVGPGDADAADANPGVGGTVVEHRSADDPFIPASVAKIPTTIAALELLGPDHRFVTELLATGSVDNGVLSGDLFLRGGGDPFLNSDDLMGFVDRLTASGITQISGGLFYDSGSLPELPQITADQPVDAHYNPGVGPLSVNFNIIELRWSLNAAAGDLSASATTLSETMRLPVDAVSFGAAPEGADAWVPYHFVEDPSGHRWLLSPQLPAEGSTRLPVRNPSLHTAMVFRRLCERRGIVLPLPAPGSAPEAAPVLADHHGSRLAFVASQILRYSNNLSAELVGLAASSRLSGRPATLGDSASALDQWFRQRMPQTDWTGFALANHSGLSTRSRTTPRQIADMLVAAAQEDYGPEAAGLGRGYAGLLRPVRWEDALNEGRDPAATRLEVRAKTGTLYYASALAGYLRAASGRWFAFAVFVSDTAARQRFDAAMDLRTTVIPEGGRAWLSRARALEREIITRWAMAY